jgi:hypothetical protein
VVASLILGILWGLWHLAAYVLLAPFSPMVFGLFLVNTLGVSVCVTWIYVHTRRSTFISTLFHGSIDAAGSLFLFGAGKNAGPIFIIVTALICLAALGIVVTNGPNLSRFRQGGAAC